MSQDTAQITVVCPYCEEQRLYGVQGVQEFYDATCPKCHKNFAWRLVTVRAKSSRQDKKSNSRSFSVRGIYPNGEEVLVKFVKQGIDDIEMRSQDPVLFIYPKAKNGKLKPLAIVSNKKINRYWKLASAGGCGVIAMVILISLIGLALLIIL